MNDYLKNILITIGVLLVIFAVLDQFNLTSWLIFPVSSAKGTNKPLTAALGNTPSTTGA